MPPQELNLTRRQMRTGVIMKLDLPSGKVVIRVPPVRNRKPVIVHTADGDVVFRVRLARSTALKITEFLSVGLFVLLAVMFGPLTLVLGAVAGPPNPNVTPTCNGQNMNPGDICEVDTNQGGTESVERYDYAQMQAQDANNGHALIIAGAVITAIEVAVGGGTVALVVWLRKKPVSVTAVPA